MSIHLVKTKVSKGCLGVTQAVLFVPFRTEFTIKWVRSVRSVFSLVTPLAPRPPTVRCRAPSSSPVVARFLLHDQVAGIKSPELPRWTEGEPSLSWTVTWCAAPDWNPQPPAPPRGLIFGRSGNHNFGTYTPRDPSNRPKICLCLLEVRGLFSDVLET